MDLLATEIRVLGSLLEKQRTTPDAYPLTLNSLRLACNQSTNRDPVVDYSEAEVRDAVQRLERRGMVRFASGAGSRAAKFRHLLSERLPMDDGEQAVMCVLMLRGAQTPGELKQRAERMHPFADLTEVEQTLIQLIERDLASSLPRRPGQKEERYMHLLGGEEQDDGAHQENGAFEPEGQQAAGASAERPTTSVPAPAVSSDVEREIAELRARVQHLEAEMASLKAELGVGAGS
jgi:uncharacterized protein YceH (UPF0502 family)